MKRSMYCTICTPQKVSNMASDLIRVPRKIMKHHETMRFGSAKMGCAMGCAEGSFHLAIGLPSIPNFYRSFWSRIKSTSRSFWRLLQDSQVDLYVPRVLPSVTTFRLCFVFQCQFDCSLRRKLCPLGCATTGTIRRIEVFRWGPWNSMEFDGFWWSIFDHFSPQKTERRHSVTGGSWRIANRSLSSDVWNSADPWVETR